MKKQNIVLVGFRGAGKSKYGKAMADAMGLPFADLDREAEFILGTTIDEFVEEHGWQVFREIEQRVVHDFSRNFSGIIATGGGTIENSKNLQNLKKTGTFVFLNPDFSKVRKFLLTDEAQKGRPRINPGIPLAQEIDQMWNQRKTIYSATADIEVSPEYENNYEEEAKTIWQSIPKNLIPEPSPKKKVAIFSSSNGSTFQGILGAQEKGRIPNAEIALFVTDKADSKALEKAKAAKIPHVEILEADPDETREEYDRQLVNLIREHQPDVVLLAGWMRILSDVYCEQFGSMTLNVHPSLLPDYAGMMGDDIHRAVIENEDRYTGATIHRVTTEVDGGEIFLQRKVLVDPTDTVEDLRKKVQNQEILGFCEALEHRKK